jgi:5-methyltetrahydrofolate--homocysteine methyltransferase
MTTLAATLTTAIQTGNRKLACAATSEALAGGIAPQSILRALMDGMDDVGRRFRSNDLFVPEVLIAARAMKSAMELVEPHLATGDRPTGHSVVIGTVEGDLHDIGKNLVAMMLKGAGFQVIDVGTNVPAADFMAAIDAHQARFVGLSALLTTTLPSMRHVVSELKAKGIVARIVVGGAPVTAEFAASIGADGYAPDAAGAVDIMRGWLANP